MNKMCMVFIMVLFSLFTTIQDSKASTDEAPVIELIGQDVILLERGVPYDELGVVVTDLEDGDLTEEVQIIHNINIHQKGSYQVTYQVTDQHHNTTIKQRTIVVLDHVIWQQSINSKNDYMQSLPLDQGEVIIVGSCESNCIALYDIDGNQKWNLFGQNDDEELINKNIRSAVFKEVKELKENVYLAISLTHIIEFNRNGQILDIIEIPDNPMSYNDSFEVNQIVMSKDRNSYTIFGTFIGREIKEDVYNFADIKTYDGRYIYAYLLHYDLSGNLKWKKNFVIWDQNQVGKMVTSDDGVYLTLHYGAYVDPYQNRLFNQNRLLHLTNDGQLTLSEELPIDISNVIDLKIHQQNELLIIGDLNTDYYNIDHNKYNENIVLLRYNESKGLVSKNVYEYSVEYAYYYQHMIAIDDDQHLLISNTDSYNQLHSHFVLIDGDGHVLLEKSFENYHITKALLVGQDELWLFTIDREKKEHIIKVTLYLAFKNLKLYQYDQEVYFHEPYDLMKGSHFLGAEHIEHQNTSGTILDEVGYYEFYQDYLVSANQQEYLFKFRKQLTIHPIITGVSQQTYYEPITPHVIGGQVKFAVYRNYEHKLGDTLDLAGDYHLQITGHNGYEKSIYFKMVPVITGIGSDHHKRYFYRHSVTPHISLGDVTLNGKPFVSGTTISKSGNYYLEISGPDYHHVIEFKIYNPTNHLLYLGIGMMLVLGIGTVPLLHLLKKHQII